MNEIGKITAFVVSASAPHRLLVFEHPMVGLQLPAGTVEPGEDPLAAAAREVREETGIEVTSQGIALGERVRELEADEAVLLETIDRCDTTFRRGHTVRVLDRDEETGVARIREEIYDYSTSPPSLVSATEGRAPLDCLASAIRRTFVLFIEEREPAGDRWLQQADGHTFEVFWRGLRSEAPLVERQREWLDANVHRIRRMVECKLGT